MTTHLGEVCASDVLVEAKERRVRCDEVLQHVALSRHQQVAVQQGVRGRASARTSWGVVSAWCGGGCEGAARMFERWPRRNRQPYAATDDYAPFSEQERAR